VYRYLEENIGEEYYSDYDEFWGMRSRSQNIGEEYYNDYDEFWGMRSRSQVPVEAWRRSWSS
jgi:hypothetical protein